MFEPRVELAGSVTISYNSNTIHHKPDILLMVRVLINSKFGVFYYNYLSLTPIFCKSSIEKYSKTPIFTGRHHSLYTYFQNPTENSDSAPQAVKELLKSNVPQTKYTRNDALDPIKVLFNSNIIHHRPNLLLMALLNL